MEKEIKIGEVNYDTCIDISDYTKFVGRASNGVTYPYVDIEHISGYKCGRCSGGCDRDVEDNIEVTITIWEED